jgi:hypothetical protein
LVSLLATSASANNEVSLRVSSNYMVDDGVYAFSENSQLVQAELTYARALFHPQRGLWAEASWTVGGSSADLFGSQLSSRALLNAFTLGARYTRPLWPWLVPMARAGLGVLIGSMRIEGNATMGSESPSISDTTAAVYGYLLGGVELLLPRRWMRIDDRAGWTVGLVIEGGLVFSSSLSWTLKPEQDEDLRLIPLDGTDIGGFSATAGVFRLGLLARF